MISRSAKVPKLPASRSSSELTAHQMAPSGVIAHQRGRPALEPMEILPSRPTTSSLYSPQGWQLRPSSSMFDVFVALRAFPLFFVFPSFSLWRTLRYYGVWLQWYAVFSWYWSYGYGAVGLRRLCREVVDQGHRPKERFFVLVLLGECELPGSRVHLPVCWGGRLLLLHLGKNWKELPVSGFHLDVQCSVSECIWKRNERETFSIWRRDGSRTLSGIPLNAV